MGPAKTVETSDKSAIHKRIGHQAIQHKISKGYFHIIMHQGRYHHKNTTKDQLAGGHPEKRLTDQWDFCFIEKKIGQIRTGCKEVGKKTIEHSRLVYPG